MNPRHRLQYSLTVREVVLTGITATIDTPMRWTPIAEELRPRGRDDRRGGLVAQGRRRMADVVAGRAGPNTDRTRTGVGAAAAAARRADDRARRGRARAAAGDHGLARRDASRGGVDPRHPSPRGTSDDHDACAADRRRPNGRNGSAARAPSPQTTSAPRSPTRWWSATTKGAGPLARRRPASSTCSHGFVSTRPQARDALADTF